MRSRLAACSSGVSCRTGTVEKPTAQVARRRLLGVEALEPVVGLPATEPPQHHCVAVARQTMVPSSQEDCACAHCTCAALPARTRSARTASIVSLMVTPPAPAVATYRESARETEVENVAIVG